MEVALAHASLHARGRLHEQDEAAIRYALSLGRCWQVRGPDGRDVAVAALLRPLRERLREVLWPLLDPARSSPAEPYELLPAARACAKAAREALDDVPARVGHPLPPEHLDREVRPR